MGALILVIFSVSFASVPLLGLVAYYRARCVKLSVELGREKMINKGENVVRLQTDNRCPDCAELDNLLKIKDDHEKSIAIIQHVRGKLRQAKGS